jgi:hypothetical protein
MVAGAINLIQIVFDFIVLSLLNSLLKNAKTRQQKAKHPTQRRKDTEVAERIYVSSESLIVMRYR